MKKLLLLTGILACMWACSKDADKVVELEGEVLAIHDEVMPRMEDIMALKSQLTKKLKTLDSLQNEGISGNDMAQDRTKVMELSSSLDESYNLMMNWMHEYKGDSAKKLNSQEAISYFENEKKKILSVKDLSKKSIDEAKLYLD
ncbi:hypothetical protein DYBT9275_00879 [Dyadobacter sp. CECT 9275]|uniref:Viral A-type inclusion protein n=1 Tax=Dyadobacter helix TaxID=2822344 RepID=A0A916NAQ4_9BACT|nr:viral A-type inclusion protein [Dyadobacter sp. CECT 9275]CAG4992031.1 hypothetical protein DYBT9275_00879 [Dyadobacter sp. CECT 9275]